MDLTNITGKTHGWLPKILVNPWILPIIFGKSMDLTKVVVKTYGMLTSDGAAIMVILTNAPQLRCAPLLYSFSLLSPQVAYSISAITGHHRARTHVRSTFQWEWQMHLFGIQPRKLVQIDKILCGKIHLELWGAKYVWISKKKQRKKWKFSGAKRPNVPQPEIGTVHMAPIP